MSKASLIPFGTVLRHVLTIVDLKFHQTPYKMPCQKHRQIMIHSEIHALAHFVNPTKPYDKSQPRFIDFSILAPPKPEFYRAIPSRRLNRADVIECNFNQLVVAFSKPWLKPWDPLNPLLWGPPLPPSKTCEHSKNTLLFSRRTQLF